MSQMILRSLLVFYAFFLSSALVAQEDLLASLSADDKTNFPVIATFKGQRIINAQSTEQLKKKNFIFNILHRFGVFSTGVQNFYGLDQAYMRFILDYAITNNLQVSLGRSNINKMYDFGLKYKIKVQSTGHKHFPISLSYYGNMGINTSTSNIYDYSGLPGKVLGRLNFTNQILIAQKLNDKFSWLLAPTSVYYNIVDLETQKNLALFVGIGGSIKISRSTRINVEYYPRLTDRNSENFGGNKTFDYLGLGFDIETGGHVFQFMFTNSSSMLEQQFLTQTTTSWSDLGIRLGFNISRTYSFEKTHTNGKW